MADWQGDPAPPNFPGLYVELLSLYFYPKVLVTLVGLQGQIWLARWWSTCPTTLTKDTLRLEVSLMLNWQPWPQKRSPKTRHGHAPYLHSTRIIRIVHQSCRRDSHNPVLCLWYQNAVLLLLRLNSSPHRITHLGLSSPSALSLTKLAPYAYCNSKYLTVLDSWKKSTYSPPLRSPTKNIRSGTASGQVWQDSFRLLFTQTPGGVNRCATAG